jgi:hypothetical protein
MRSGRLWQKFRASPSDLLYRPRISEVAASSARAIIGKTSIGKVIRSLFIQSSLSVVADTFAPAAAAATWLVARAVNPGIPLAAADLQSDTAVGLFPCL